MQKKVKPKYNMFQNLWYMVRRSQKKGTRRVPWFCAVTALLTVFISVTELVITPAILGKVENTAPLNKLLLTIVLFAGSLLVLSAVKAYIGESVRTSRILGRFELLNDIHTKFCTTSYPNTEDSRFITLAEKASIAVGSNNSATEAIWSTATDLLRDILGFVLYLILLSALNPLLFAVILLLSATGYFVNARLNEWGFRHREELAAYEGKIGYIANRMEDIKLAKDVRIFGMQSWLEDIYNTTMRAYKSFFAKGQRQYFWGGVVDAVLAFLRNGVAYFILISMALEEGLPASEFLLYFGAVSGFATWVTGILNQLSTLQKQGLDISVIREYLEWHEQFNLEKGEDVSLPSEIRFENVSFRYPNAEEDTLHDINIIIPIGEKLAIVGLNGAGKSTFVKLLCGLYDPTEGRVLFGGKDIRDFDRRKYYKMFSAVFQDFSVLEAPLIQNVAQDFENIDENRVLSCLEMAGLTDKLHSLPNGLNTPMGRKVFLDGTELSGGETQRLMLARALYKNGSVLVLDEPTAALDPIAENDIYQKYNRLAADRTALFISHRLASTRFCDRILFLADGGIAEEGTHESLLASGGKYAQLFEVQSRYYRENAVTVEEETV